jgi:hypothetical protein
MQAAAGLQGRDVVRGFRGRFAHSTTKASEVQHNSGLLQTHCWRNRIALQLRHQTLAQSKPMLIFARWRFGRVLLHLLAMLCDRHVRFHFKGMIRELPWLAVPRVMLRRARVQLVDALVLYLAQPLKHCTPPTSADLQQLAARLVTGDVLLSDGNTRVAALVKRVTRSRWSHVSMYVGPLEGGRDPRCIVEADIAAGVRAIRISELDAVSVRVLRPVGMDDVARARLAGWVVSRIGGKYDLGQALAVARTLLWPPPASVRPSPKMIPEATTSFICCSLLAQAFALHGRPIRPVRMHSSPHGIVDDRSLTPGDFERASLFEVVRPLDDAPSGDLAKPALGDPLLSF